MVDNSDRVGEQPIPTELSKDTRYDLLGISLGSHKEYSKCIWDMSALKDALHDGIKGSIKYNLPVVLDVRIHPNENKKDHRLASSSAFFGTVTSSL